MNKKINQFIDPTLKTPSSKLDQKILSAAKEKFKPASENQWLSLTFPIASLAMTIFFLIHFTQTPFENNQELGFYENLELVEYQQSIEHFEKIDQLSDEEWKLITMDSKGL